MSSQKTTNYDLNQWLPADSVLRTDFNADNAKIDAALQALADTAAGKADAGDLSALENTVAGQAAQIAQKGNCQIYTTSYTGTGGVNEAGACQLTFPTPPVLFIIGNYTGHGICVGRGSVVQIGTDVKEATTWSADGLTVSWHNYNASMQLNEEGELYQVVAFLSAES